MKPDKLERNHAQLELKKRRCARAPESHHRLHCIRFRF